MGCSAARCPSMAKSFAIALVVVACAGALACGSAPRRTPAVSPSARSIATARTAPARLRADSDGDGDSRAGRVYDRDDAVLSRFGRPARPHDRRAIFALLADYRRAALAGDGTTACRLLYAPLARGLRQDEGARGYGPRFAQGLTTCPAIMSALFAHSPEEAASATVRAVRVGGSRAVVLLSFKSEPAGFIEARRQGSSSWKIDQFGYGRLP